MGDMEEVKSKLEELLQRLTKLKPAFGIDEARKRLTELRKASEDPSLWSDSASGQKTMRALSDVEKEVAEWDGLERGLLDVRSLYETSITENDRSLTSELSTKLDDLEQSLDLLEHSLLFNGPYDRDDAYLSIYAGTGGTDAQDFAEMLLRMYLRFAERSGFKAEIQSISEGEEAGLKSVTMKIEGKLAYGLLKSEHGVHRLVRQSPFNAQNLRQTSFVLVDVLPILEESSEIELKDSELRIDVFRSSGAGGQSVNTTDSAVRITHISSGLTATCQNERSQLQNREKALEILKAKLARKAAEERSDEAAKVRGEVASAEWGSQIRSYVLHPYQMVKDHRTNYETSDTSGVLDGKLSDFIDSYLSWSASSK